MRRPFVNTHCHFLNFGCIPRQIMSLFCRIPAKFLNDPIEAHLIGWLVERLGLTSFDKVRQYLRLLQKPLISEVAAHYLEREMGLDIDLCVPLMMDLSQSVPRDIRSDIFRYEDQIKHMSLETAQYPWRVFPFVMFDPRRQNSVAVVKDALERKGFIGVKMYPALGYYPDPAKMESREAGAADNLRAVYELCRDGRVPITTHASPGGAYSTSYSQLDSSLFSEITNWEQPMTEYGLKVNFAHFGGNYQKEPKSRRWREAIIAFMRGTIAHPGCGRAYGDLSYQELAFSPGTSSQYFDDLKRDMQDPAVANSLLFGTDWHMTAHTWTEREYIKPFVDAATSGVPELQRTFTENPIEFLFGGYEIPQRYVDFIRANADPSAFAARPEWIKEENDRYRIVPV